MFNLPDLPLDLALDRHQERIAAAQRQRLVTRTRRARKERQADATRRQQASTERSNRPTPSRRNAGLANWLIRVGDVVSQFSTAELDGHRRPALGVLADELLNAARARGADAPPNPVDEDSAVVVLRTLGRLAASTAGRPIRVSRRRARMLQTALDDLVEGHDAEVTQPRTRKTA